MDPSPRTGGSNFSTGWPRIITIQQFNYNMNLLIFHEAIWFLVWFSFHWTSAFRCIWSEPLESSHLSVQSWNHSSIVCCSTLHLPTDSMPSRLCDRWCLEIFIKSFDILLHLIILARAGFNLTGFGYLCLSAASFPILNLFLYMYVYEPQNYKSALLCNSIQVFSDAT